MSLVAQALAGVDLDRLDFEVRSLGEDREGAPWAVDLLNHLAILPDPQKDSYMHMASARPSGSFPMPTAAR
jgi:hypothetical protein